MLFIRSNWRDIEKYFHHTFIKFQEFGDKLFFINSVSPDMITGTDQDGNDFELLMADSVPYVVDYILPNRAVFQHKASAYMLQRIPARQYRRGLCDQNTQIINLDNGEKQSISFTVLKSFVTKQKYFTLTEAIERKGKLRSYAINARFHYNPNTAALFCDRKQIGTYDYQTKTLNLNALFLPEIQELMQNNQETFGVTTHA